LSEEGYLPISLDPNRALLEKAMIAEWTIGHNPSLATVLDGMRKMAATSSTEK
jgi:hypothetical protein